MIQREINPKYVSEVLRRRWLIISLLAILGSSGGYLACQLLPKRFTSQTLVLVQQPTVSADLVRPVVSDNTNQRLAAMQQQILSRSRLEPVIRHLGLYGAEIDRVPTDILVERLRQAITITPVQPMAETRAQHLPGFTISVVFDEPHLAQQICAKITSMFLEENVQSRQDQAEQTTEFLASQLEDAKAKLDAQDARLAAFKRQYLGSLPDNEQMNLNILTGLSSQLDAVTQALTRAQQDKSFTESLLAQQLAAWQATQSGQNPETYEQQLTTLQNQLVALQSKYTDDYPDVIKAKNDIKALRQKIAEADREKKTSTSAKSGTSTIEPPQIQQLRAQIHQYEQVIQDRSSQQEDIQNQIKVYQARVQSTPAVEQEYKELTRDYQTALDFYNDLLKKRDQSAMATDLERRQQGEQFQVLDPANLPDQPSFPQPRRFLGGGFAGGLGLGLALTLLLEIQDTSLKSERDVEVNLHLPVLAMIPVISHGHRKSKSQTTLFGSPRARAG